MSISSAVRRAGPPYLLPAGCRAEDPFGAYAQAAQEFDWTDFYVSYAGEAYFEWMRRQLLARDVADVVLIDSPAKSGLIVLSSQPGAERVLSRVPFFPDGARISLAPAATI